MAVETFRVWRGTTYGKKKRKEKDNGRYPYEGDLLKRKGWGEETKRDIPFGGFKKGGGERK